MIVRLTIACSEHRSLVLRTRAAGTRAIRVEVADGVVPGDESGGVGQEVGSVGEENHHGECVAKQEFTNASDE